MRLLFTSLAVLISYFFMPDKNSSADIQFHDQNKKPIFSFGLIADAQYSDNDHVGTRFYRLSSQKLKEAAESLKIDSVDFIINLGDIIDKDFESYKKSTGPTINHFYEKLLLLKDRLNTKTASIIAVAIFFYLIMDSMI